MQHKVYRWKNNNTFKAIHKEAKLVERTDAINFHGFHLQNYIFKWQSKDFWGRKLV
jgi:hypothetical protein